MLFSKNICSSLILSAALSLGFGASSLAAAETPPAAASKKASVNASDLTEVIQVLYISNMSAVAQTEVVLAKDPDAGLKGFAEMSQAVHSAMLKEVKDLAVLKNVGLELGDLTATSQLVKTNVERDLLILAGKREEEFRPAFLSIVSYQYQKMVKVLEQIEGENQDSELRALAADFRNRLLALTAKAEAL